MQPNDADLRLAVLTDLPAIVAIYNQAVKRGFCTADTSVFKVEQKEEWFRKHGGRHPVYVAVVDGNVTGWYALSAYREGRQALSGVREISYYVHDNFQKRGIGSLLITHAIETARGLGIENLIAIVLEKNAASISLLAKHGFVKWGHMPDVANFDGQRCGHLYFGLSLKNQDAAAPHRSLAPGG